MGQNGLAREPDGRPLHVLIWFRIRRLIRMRQRLSHGTLAAGFGLAALTIAFACGLTPVRASAPATNRHVILISLDGFAAYMLADQTLPVPALRALAKNGVMAEAMIGVNPTVTWPNHTSTTRSAPMARSNSTPSSRPSPASRASTAS
jgi:hypothetical protein